MNTKRALSLILLVSLLSQSNVFGMFKMTKLFKSVSTPIFYNTTPSNAVLFSGFSTAKRSKKQKIRVLQKRTHKNKYKKLLDQNNQLRNRIKTNKKIVSEIIKETNSQLIADLSVTFGFTLLSNAYIAFVPTGWLRVPASIMSAVYMGKRVENSINTQMDNLVKKLAYRPKKIRRKKKVIKIKKK